MLRARTLLPGPLTFKRTGIVHRITIETRPGRAPDPVWSRWSCSCGAHGGWESEAGGATATNAAADSHAAEVRS